MTSTDISGNMWLSADMTEVNIEFRGKLKLYFTLLRAKELLSCLIQLKHRKKIDLAIKYYLTQRYINVSNHRRKIHLNKNEFSTKETNVSTAENDRTT